MLSAVCMTISPHCYHFLKSNRRPFIAQARTDSSLLFFSTPSSSSSSSSSTTPKKGDIILSTIIKKKKIKMTKTVTTAFGEESFEIPEGLRANAIRLIKNAYESCVISAETNQLLQVVIPKTLSEASADRFFVSVSRIPEDRDGGGQSLTNTVRREYLKAIAADVKLATKLISMNFEVCREALIKGKLTLREVAEESRRVEDNHKWRKNVIKTLHEKLRHGEETNKNDLARYSKAAAETGKSKWVKNILKWSFDFFEHYFGKIEDEEEEERENYEEGKGIKYKNTYKRTRRKLIISLGEDVGKLAPSRESINRKRKREESEIGEEEHFKDDFIRKALMDLKLRYSGNCIFGKKKKSFRLLDVGSCWDFYRDFEQKTKSSHFWKCKVVSFDLEPEISAKNVLKGDFLNLQFFDKVDDKDDDDDDNIIKKSFGDENLEHLEALRTSAFNVVILSLVLTYVPTPEKRFQMIMNARKCLKATPGDGLLLIVEPHGFDKTKENIVAKTWQKTIETVGFRALVNSKTGDGLHVLVFETTEWNNPSKIGKLSMALDKR